MFRLPEYLPVKIYPGSNLNVTSNDNRYQLISLKAHLSF